MKNEALTPISPSRRLHLSDHEERLSPRTRIAVLIFTSLFVVGISLLMVRGIIFRPGTIQYTADFTAHIDQAHELAAWSGGWNEFLGDDNAAVLSQAPLLGPLTRAFGSGLAQRIALALAYGMMALTSFHAIRSWIMETRVSSGPATSIAALGALVYTINPWVAIESVHLFYLWLYALLPATIHAVRRALTVEDRKTAVYWSCLAALSGVATLTAFGIAFHAAVVLCMLLANAALANRAVSRRIGRSLIVGICYIVASMAASMYWLLPIMLGFRSSFSSGTSWSLFTTKDMFILSPYTSWEYALTGSYREATDALTGGVVDSQLASVGRHLGFAIAAAAFLGLLIRGRDRRLIFGLTLSVVLALVLANGTGNPTGKLYLGLADAPVLRRFAFVLFKGPYKWVPVALCGMIILASLSIAYLWSGNRLQRTLAACLAASIIGWAIIGGSPLLTGDLDGYLRPVKVSPSYASFLSRLARTADEGGPARIVWLPIDRSGSPPPPPGAPTRSVIPLIHGGYPPLAAWTSPVPISSRGASWLGPAVGRVFDQFLEWALLHGSSTNVGDVMAKAGRRYVVIRRDVSPNSRLLEDALTKRGDFDQILTDPGFAVFKARSDIPRLERTAAPAVIVGGLEQLLFRSTSEAGVTSPYVLLADLPPSRAVVRQLLRSTSAIAFAPGKDWTDLAISTGLAGGSQGEGASARIRTVPLGPWDRETFDSHTWLPYRLAGLEGQRFDPAQSRSFLVAANSSRLSVQLMPTSPTTQFWVRVLLSPGLQVLRASVNGKSLPPIAAENGALGGWRWIQLGSARTTQHGRVLLTLHATGSLIAIDRIAALPTGAVERAVADLRSLTLAAGIQVRGTIKDLPLGEDERPASSTHISRRLFVPRSGVYHLLVSLPKGSQIIDAKLGLHSVELRRNGDWAESRPVALTQGNAVLQLPQEVPEESAFVLSATPISAPEHRPADRGFIILRETYNAGWRASHREVAHFRVDGFVNGFLSDGPAAVRFGPDDYLGLGRTLSASTALLVIAAFLYSKRRNRKKESASEIA